MVLTSSGNPDPPSAGGARDAEAGAFAAVGADPLAGRGTAVGAEVIASRNSHIREFFLWRMHGKDL